MHVAVLGTGIMGSGMAANLARAGHEVTVWNRTRSRANALAEREDVRIHVADTPVSAATGVDAVVTVLFDRPAVETAVTGPAGAFAALGTPLWVQCSTVGTEIEVLARAARELGWRFLDAPVLGTRGPAEQGSLTTLVSGAARDRAAAQPLFDAWGSRTVVAGDEPGDASRLKLVANSWIGGLLAALAESITVARRLGVDPELFLDAIEGSAVHAPYARMKGEAMIRRDHPPQFPLAGMVKDLELITGAAGEPSLAGLQATLRAAHRALEAGHGDEDMSALIEAME